MRSLSNEKTKEWKTKEKAKKKKIEKMPTK